jgi:hypothetical protein
MTKGRVPAFTGHPVEGGGIAARSPWTLVCCAMINTLIAFYLERDYSAAVAMARRVIRTYPALPREAWLGLVLDRWQPDKSRL